MRPIAGVPEGFLIDGLLTRAECEQLISDAEAIGLKPKRSRRSGPPIRNNSRALYQPSAALTAQLQARLLPLLTCVDLRAIGESWALPADGQFLNPKWRINSYATGEAFLPHYDSGHDFGRGKRTLLSLIIYLNDDFTGGETTFFPADPTEEPLQVDELFDLREQVVWRIAARMDESLDVVDGDDGAVGCHAVQHLVRGAHVDAYELGAVGDRGRTNDLALVRVDQGERLARNLELDGLESVRRDGGFI